MRREVSQGRIERWSARPRLWEQPGVRLFGGHHGLPPSLVRRIQRDRLIDAAVVAIAKRGYHGTSVERIIAQAGVSRRTFYDVFRDKQECFLATYDEVVSWALAFTFAAHERGGDPLDRIERALDAYLGFWAHEPDAARTCLVEARAAGPEARARRAATTNRLADLIETDLHELEQDDGLRRIAARSFAGALQELTYTRVHAGRCAELPALAEPIIAAAIAPLVAS